MDEHDRALEIAREAWTKWPRKNEMLARRYYVKSRLSVAMLWDLIDRYDHGVGERLLQFLLAKAKGVDEPPPQHEQEFEPLPIMQRRNDDMIRLLDELVDRADAAAETLGDHDRSVPETAAAIIAQDHVEVCASRFKEDLGRQTKLRLMEFMIDGKPLANCTAGEALAWCDRQERDVDFVRQLCSGVPLGDTLGKWYNSAPSEVEEIWRRVNTPESFERRRRLRERFENEWAEAKQVAERIDGDLGLRVLNAKAQEIDRARHKLARCSSDAHLKAFPDPLGGMGS